MKRKRVQLFCLDPSKAIQSQKDESDINTIVRNFGVTGRLPESTRLPQYGDFYGIEDYRSAIEAVKDADKAFMELPAKVREYFVNDPQAFADFAINPENLPQLREWGLAPTPPTPVVQGG